MKMYGGVDVQIHVFLTLALFGSGHLHAPASLPPGKELPVTHWIGGWVGTRTGLYEVEKKFALTGTRIRSPRPSSQWPVAIQTARHYPGSSQKQYSAGNRMAATVFGEIFVFMGVRQLLLGAGTAVLVSCSLIRCGRLGWRSKPIAIFHELPKKNYYKYVNNW
jgi:hypothetical protein